MRKTTLMLSLMAGAAAASPAYAQMAGTTGRAEIRVGYDELGGTVTVDEFERETFGAGDLGIGVELGADAVVANGLLFGGYVGADHSFADHCEDDPFFPGGEVCLEPGRNLYAGVRAGFATGDNGLVYIKGGYSNAKLKASYQIDDDEEFSDSDSSGGWHLGAGFEIGLMSNVYIKGEYTYTKYRNFFEDTIDETSEVDLNRHQILGGLGIRFGGATPPPPPLPPAPPPPPPVEAPATQTCPDGSVILATDACPLPPPPPPPPPVESPGERG